MLSREEWLPLARKLDWDYTYVREDEVFPQVISGHPWLPHAEWKEWEESFNSLLKNTVSLQLLFKRTRLSEGRRRRRVNARR